MDNSVYGWHIVLVDENGTPYLSRDLEHVEVTAGLTVTMPREEVVGIAADGICGPGLYMSRDIVDALKYAPNGEIAICRVLTTASAIVQEDEGKLVTTERTVIAMLDAEKTHHVLVGWVMRRAEQALALVDNPDPCSVEALATVKRWMEGEATQEELEAATRAATYAARVAARAATDAADAADAAVRAKQNEQLESMLLAAMGLS